MVGFEPEDADTEVGENDLKFYFVAMLYPTATMDWLNRCLSPWVEVSLLLNESAFCLFGHRRNRILYEMLFVFEPRCRQRHHF